ncbi:MAG: PKD domain-containing protein [Bacteroidales bacterium]|nr:PKD domain-containing protein [Bacteroidales bacterium]MCF8390328.1 PKD domain-containing protein [Bacteroidales bacterium]
MENKRSIEKLFEEKFQSYHPEPSPELWPKLSRQLKWRNFMRPSWDSFNIAYLSGIIIASAITIWVLTNRNNESKVQDVKNSLPEMEDLSNEVRNNENISTEINPSDSNNTSIQQAGVNKAGNTKNLSSTRNEKTGLSDKNSDPSKTASLSVAETRNTSESSVQHPEPEIRNSALPPRAFFISSSETGCAPLQISFTNLSTEADNFTWSFGDGGQSNELNPEYIFDNPGEYFVTLTAKNENDDISVYHTIIRVNEVPEASFMIEKQEDLNQNISVYFYNYSRGAESYSWDFGDGNISTEANPTHVFDTPGNYDILLKVSSNYGCIDTMILSNALKSQNPVIKIPNAFSPNKNGPNGGYYSNGENRNEIFHPSFIETPVEYQLRIFNRNGNLLFESKDLNIGWDGYYMQELQPRGVYIYKLRVKFENGEYLVKMGDVTVFIQD